ncbi:MAG TPA: amino acid adenylation domain-containing protein [Candidatus Nanopelagicales bacterium]|nr:amino acid adenylation domain-containing protein [Candidatus Nanopelagicales bacterium]
MTAPVLTRSQEGVVYAQLVHDCPARYTVGELVELSGPVEPAHLATAVARAVAEAEVHRLRVSPDGIAGLGPIPLTADQLISELVDLSPEPDPLAAALDWSRSQISAGIGFGEDALYGHRLLRLGPDRLAWLASSHHVLLDGYATVLVIRRALEIYAALVEGAEVPGCRFTAPAAVAAAERAYESSAAYVRDREHWRAAAAEADRVEAVRGLLVRSTPGAGVVRSAPGAGIVRSAPGSGVVPSTPGAGVVRSTPGSGIVRSTPGAGVVRSTPGAGVVRVRGDLAATAAELDARAERLAGAGWPDLVAAAHAVALARLAGARDVVVGIPLMNRWGAAALAPVSTVNVLPLALSVRPTDTVAALVARTADALRALRQHGRFRHEELARLTGRVTAGRGLVGSELNLKLFDQPDRAGGAAVRLHNLAEGPVDDIGLSVYRDPGTGTLSWESTAPDEPGGASDSRAVASGFAATVDQVLTGLATADADAPVGSLAGRSGSAQTGSAQTGSAQTGSAQTGSMPAGSMPAGSMPARSMLTGGPAAVRPPLVADLLADLTRRYPGRVALVDDQQRLDHRGLADRVAAVAARLREHCPPTGRVALEIPRGVDAVVGLLAGLTSGRTMVPIDPTWPDRRRADLRAGAGVDLVLDSAAYARFVAEPVTDPQPEPVPRDAVAYVVHTSGSTGRPKGVAVTQDALAHFLAHHRATTYATVANESVRVAQSLPLEFDGCWDTLQALLFGHRVHLLPRAVTQDPAATVRRVHADRLAVVDTTPTVMAALVADGLFAPGHPLRMVSVGGEGCPPALWQQLLDEPGVQVANYYGPTEVTVDATGVLIPPGPDRAGSQLIGSQRVGIGRPLRGIRAYVLDDHLAPVPPGVAGELYLAGPQLALGYLGQPGLTASRFVADPGAPGSRMYRTGDRVSIAADGSLDYHGRRDDQIKVRGYRVEPAEVEAALRRLPGVDQVAVGARDGRLVAAVVGLPGAAPTPAGLRDGAADLLPAHLVPSVLAVVDALPRTTTGKLDLAALATICQPTGAPGTNGRMEQARDPLATPAECALGEAVAAGLGLGIADLDRDSDFFGLGGDSITAITVVGELRRRGWATSVSQVFTHQTLARIAAHAEPYDPTPAPAGAGSAAPQTGLDERQLAAVHDLLARRRRR